MKIRHIVDEKVLLSQLKDGKEKAFEQLYHLYSFRLYGFLLRLIKDEEVSRDLLQDVFIKIWDKRELIDPERSFRSYLFRIAENNVVDFFRKVACDKKLQVKLTVAATELYSHIEEAIYSREHLKILNQVVNELPPQCRLVFTLCKLEGKSYKEVSQTLGISVSTISNHLQKATQFIRQNSILSDSITILVIACFLK
ncbi:RNA polymerase sigma factor [Mucilaginibacter boryungensis]|uniref:RNA polymerase sigma-70 factor n=1 Tax=Mucilaginibacter boryungensis TaxID=768480 RepID=A0ABR9XDC7_9SPHI|nr:RNA polymerase sigma-70 factor [Mucilaginibacter boryungensis]MBE9665397.1 RNA polymerase sigma-70 factor [Mucilaginibacter boryungensis]